MPRATNKHDGATEQHYQLLLLGSGIRMCDIYEEIAQADELERLLKAVLERYTDWFPDWEMSAIPLQKSIDRNEQIDLFIAILQSMKTLP